MSAPGKVIYTLLGNSAAVTNLVGTNFYAMRVPEATPAPYIVINKVSEVRDTPIDFVPGAYPRTARMQVSCYGSSAGAAKALADAVKSACDQKTGTIAGVVVSSVMWDSDAPDAYDFDVNLFHQPVDFFIIYYL